MAQGQLVGFLVENNVLVTIIIALFISLVLLARKLPSKDDDPADPMENVPDSVSVEDIVEPQLQKKVLRKGDDVGVQYYEGKKHQGYIKKELKETEADEPIEIRVKDRSSDSNATTETKKVRLFYVLPSGSAVKKGIRKITNPIRKALGKDVAGEIEIITEDLIKSEDHERIVLKPDIDWDYDAGVWLATSTATQNVKKRIIMDRTLNKLLQEVPAYVEKVSAINPFNTMAIERKKAEKDEDSQIRINSG